VDQPLAMVPRFGEAPFLCGLATALASLDDDGLRGCGGILRMRLASSSRRRAASSSEVISISLFRHRAPLSCRACRKQKMNSMRCSLRYDRRATAALRS
jgi:hypothetical protein